MRKFRFRLPSPAMIVALIALVVAMVGTTYAAVKLPKNSVASKQLKKNSVTGAKIKKDAVTGAKIKNQSLTGEDINLAKLGTVPSAQLANTIPPAEPTHLIGAPGEPGFESGSSNLGSIEGINVKPAGFYKDHEGIVHLQGMVKVGEPGLIGTIFSLPPGFRPASGQLTLFSSVCLGGSSCPTDSNGDEGNSVPVIVFGSNVNIATFSFNGAVAAEEGAQTSLDGITFKAES